MRVRAEAVLSQPGEHLPLRAELEALACSDAVDPDRKRTVGRDRGVLLPQRAGGGVARVRRELLARSPQGARSAPGTPRSAGTPLHAPRGASGSRCRACGAARSPIVRRLAVTSSPWMPSPRVAPRASTPFSYVRLMARPSIFGSTTYATGSSEPRRFRTSSAHLSSASELVTFSSDPIGVACTTFWKPPDAGAPTRCVGESGVTSSG